MTSLASNTLTVNLPATSAYPVLNLQAVIGDVIEVQAEIFEKASGLATGVFVQPGPLALGVIELNGYLTPGTYELRGVRIKDNANDGAFDAAATVDLVVPSVSIALSNVAVTGINAVGGLLRFATDVNCTLYWAVTATNVSYVDAAGIKAAAGALASGSVPANAGLPQIATLFDGGQELTNYKAHFYAERDVLASPIETQTFTTLSTAQLVPDFASASVAVAGATNTRFAGSLTAAGDVWALTLAAAAPAPTVAEIKAGGGVWSFSDTGVTTFSATQTGVAIDNQYTTYAVANIDGNDTPITVLPFAIKAAVVGGSKARRISVIRGR